MYLPSGDSSGYAVAPAGMHIARCVRFVDLGSSEKIFNGKSKGLMREVLLVFELPEEVDGDKPFLVSKSYTWSMYEKANLRKDLESWRGKKFQPEDFGPNGFDTKKLLGVAAMLNVIHAERNDKTYANIASIGPIRKGEVVPPQVHESIYFSLEPGLFDESVFAKLSERLQQRISQTPEYQKIKGDAKEEHSDTLEVPAEEEYDDIPF